MKPLQLSVPQKISLIGHYTFTLTNIHTGEAQVFEYDNVVTEDYWEVIANHVVSPAPTYSMLVTTAVLGTGTSPPATSDSSLQTQVYSNAVASKSNTGNVADATAHFNATETTGTYREAGLKTSDGILVSRVAINITKTTSHTLTLDWQLIIS